jgi:hypothetical protein
MKQQRCDPPLSFKKWRERKPVRPAAPSNRQARRAAAAKAKKVAR